MQAGGPYRAIDRVWRFFASVKLTIVLLLVLAGAMAYGTFVETTMSNGAARLLVYRTWWFDGLIGLLALNLIGCTLRRAPYKPHQAGWITTHIALLILMAGSVMTHRMGMQGQMVIAEGDAENTFFLEQLDRGRMDIVSGEARQLPFEVRCVKFDQLFYPGTGMTRLFRSRVDVLDPARRDTVKHDIILNHPLVYGGYKISQSSFMDLPNGARATVLGVSYDPGIPLMYIGGGLLVLGMAGIFFLKPYLKRKFPPPPKIKRDSFAPNPRLTQDKVSHDTAADHG
jgi:cytochrome c biogenesis protein ResB